MSYFPEFCMYMILKTRVLFLPKSWQKDVYFFHIQSQEWSPNRQPHVFLFYGKIRGN